MKPHEERVVQEKKDLDEKLTKLQTFVDGPVFSQIAPQDRDLLLRQRSHMRKYSEVLGLRIARFA